MLVEVDGMSFAFPEGWIAHKYDEWSFYRLSFAKVRDTGVKAVDLIAFDPRTWRTWLIEVKDYRHHPRTKPSSVAEEMAAKVLDTLAALLPAKINGNDPGEQDMATRVLGSRALHLVLHLEQPRKHSRLFPRAIDPANVKQDLRRRLKPVDAHPRVVESSRMHHLEWRVTLA